jgi:hypothetical protein
MTPAVQRAGGQVHIEFESQGAMMLGGLGQTIEAAMVELRVIQNEDLSNYREGQKLEVETGLGRIVALCHRSSTSYRIH